MLNAKFGQSKTDRHLEASQRKLQMKDSVLACLFLSLYVGTYMAAGFASVTAVEWAWLKLAG
jgi:hypothetical protein